MKKELKIVLIAASVLIVLAVFFLSFKPKVAENKEQTPTEQTNEFDPSILTWQQVEDIPFEKRDSHTVYVFNDNLFLTSGLDSDDSKLNSHTPVYEKAVYYNDIWVSVDGMNWNKIKDHAEFPLIRSTNIIEFKGSLYLLGGWSPTEGYSIGIWKSNDGINWKKVKSKPEFGAIEGHKVIEFQGKLLLIGGVNYATRKTSNSVWESEDGVNWTLLTSAPFHSRWDHDVISYDNKLFLMGGMDLGDKGFSDVWESEDGKNWNLILDDAPWGKRQGLGVVSFHDYIFLVGGLDAIKITGIGDSWYSKNGINWTKTKKDGKWLGREDHGVIVFKDKIFVLGGMDENFNWHNDVWYSNF